MELLDGLNNYKVDTDFWNFTSSLEIAATEVTRLVQEFGQSPSDDAPLKAHRLLVKIELWKAGCVEELTGNYAAQNPESIVWNAFRDAINAMNARNDVDALLSIMRLKGFGKHPNEDFGNQRPAKRASAVLRMFNPVEWGVVDWRTAAMLWALEKKDWNIDQAMSLARSKYPNRATAKAEFEMINEDFACHLNQMYRGKRSVSLSRTADVEMAVFGITFEVWELPATTSAARRRVA
jgi:hypothetical protein